MDMTQDKGAFLLLLIGFWHKRAQDKPRLLISRAKDPTDDRLKAMKVCKESEQ